MGFWGAGGEAVDGRFIRGRGGWKLMVSVHRGTDYCSSDGRRPVLVRFAIRAIDWTGRMAAAKTVWIATNWKRNSQSRLRVLRTAMLKLLGR